MTAALGVTRLVVLLAECRAMAGPSKGADLSGCVKVRAVTLHLISHLSEYLSGDAEEPADLRIIK
jgi:hypothetical protein